MSTWGGSGGVAGCRSGSSGCRFEEHKRTDEEEAEEEEEEAFKWLSSQWRGSSWSEAFSLSGNGHLMTVSFPFVIKSGKREWVGFLF